MATITETKQKKDFVGTMIKAVKAYFGFALLILIGTIPTKAVYLLASYLWNLF